MVYIVSWKSFWKLWGVFDCGPWPRDASLPVIKRWFHTTDTNSTGLECPENVYVAEEPVYNYLGERFVLSFTWKEGREGGRVEGRKEGR